MNWWQKLKSFGWFNWFIFDFSMAEIDKRCWMWIQCFDPIYMENVFDAHFIEQYIADICMPIRESSRAIVVQALNFKCISYDAEFASWRTADCHCRHPASSGTACGAVCRPKQYPITFSAGTFRYLGWNSSPTWTLLRTLLSRWSPRDLPSDTDDYAASAAAAAGAATRRSRGTRTPSCRFRHCCNARYVNVHLISAIHILYQPFFTTFQN